MPYIDSLPRQRINKHGIDGVATAGELNYWFTKEILEYLGDYPKYEDYNEVIGVLECVKQELYRRKIAPYEQEKCKLNGDVF